MKVRTESRVNVAPTSDSGHYVEKAEKVVNLDEVTESFFVEGSSIMTTKNHTNLSIEGGSLVSCQQVYNPFSKMMEKAKD